MNTTVKIGIIGAGSLGILYGHKLTKAYGKENVLFLADEERCLKYKETEFICNGERSDFQFVSTGRSISKTENEGTDEEIEALNVSIKSCNESCNEQANHIYLDLLIFAVKSMGLAAAIEEAKPFVSENTVILSLLNGITSEEQIGAVFGKKHMLYSVALGMDPIRKGYQISFQNIGKIVFGSRYGNQVDDVRLVSKVLEKADIPYDISDDIMYVLWKKLMLNTGVNQVIAVYASTYGGMQQEGEIRTKMIEAMREVVEVSKHEGVNLTEEDIRENVALLDTMNPEGMPSMRQDTKAGKKTEVELFSGTICRLGRKYNIPTPVNDFFYEKIREMEA
ncbi:MAG: ketopantoate reductase family protein [Clostridiales bacterium]|nr:ketopantoate reductase family protein [Clostridiales bacterium]